MEFAFDDERERLSSVVTAAIAGSPLEPAPGPFDRNRWDEFHRGPGAAVTAEVSEEAIGSAASVTATLEALVHTGGIDAALIAFGFQLAGVLHPLVGRNLETQRAAWLTRLFSGEAFGAPVVPARPGEGVTMKRSTGGFVVDGTGAVASFGLRPDCLVVPVNTGGDGAEPSALLFLPVEPCLELDRQPAARDFLAPDHVTFRGLAVSEDRALFGGETGRDHAAHAQAVFCLGIHAMRVGLLQRLGDVAIEAARAATRRMKLTGHPPARFQALTHPIADFLVRCDAARLLVHEGARRLDESDRVPIEALLAAFDMDTALLPYAADVVGLQRHWGLAEGDAWSEILGAATALGRYAWSPVELSEQVCASLRERPRPW
ncbi:MAG: acyl-CoA dehydrogenase family protein [Nitrospirota bacterium]